MNVLFTDWLERVEAAAAGLPADRREDLVDDLTEHLAAADTPGLDEVGARAVLERLGSPEQVVAAAWQETPTPLADGGQLPDPRAAAAPAASSAPSGPRRGSSLDPCVLVCLLGGAVLAWAYPPLALIGLVGVGLLWFATGWTRRQRTTGTVMAVAVPVLLMLVALVVLRLGDGQSCDASGGFCSDVQLDHTFGLGSWELLFLMLAMPIVSTVCWLATSLYLGLKLRANRRAQAPASF